MRRFAVVAVVLCVAAATATPAARAATPLPLERVETIAGDAVAGGRYVAYLRTPTEVRVRDTATGRAVSVSVAAGCRVADVGGGLVLVACGDGRPSIHHAATGDERPVVGWEGLHTRAVLGGFVGISPRAIGRRWMAVDHATHQSGITRYLDWRRGEAVDAPVDPTRFADLDAPTLVRVLCSPLRRTPRPRELPPGDPFMPFAVDGRWGLDLGERSLTLRRCGSPRELTLPCALCWNAAQLEAGALSWLGASGPRLRELRCGRVFAPRLRGPEPVRVAIAHGRHDVAVTAVRRDPATGRVDLTFHRAARPGCGRRSAGAEP